MHVCKIIILFQRERCLENVQSIIHDHYYEQSSLNDKDEDSQKVNYFAIEIIKYNFHSGRYLSSDNRRRSSGLGILVSVNGVSEIHFQPLFRNDLEQNNLSFAN